jgi:serine/threonine protein kinase
LENYSYIVLPFCERGTLLDLLLKVIKSERKLSDGLQKYLSKQLVMALLQLHNVDGLAHLDLKPDNIVITNDLRLALIDFGHANYARTPICLQTGTAKYLAPEVREVYYGSQNRYMPELVDSFDFGVTLFIIVFGRMPFGSATFNDPYYRHVMEQDFTAFFTDHKAFGYPMDALMLIWECLSYDPS